MARVAEREISVRPPLKWAGGKRWQVPRLRAIWRAHQDRRLVEPFCGGLAVVLGLGPRRALLNDANPHLINFYRWLKRGLVVDLPMENNRTAFNRHRGRFNDLIEAGRTRGREAAALFYYLNRTGYNGLCRFNRQGAFNVPFGRYARINYQTDFLAFRDVFADWTFTNDDIADVRFRPDDFVYADPPYDVEFRQYGPLGFTWDDQVRTAERLADHAGPVVLVNQATPRIDRLYRTLGFRLRRLDGPRRISSSGDRRPAREIIATRNL